MHSLINAMLRWSILLLCVFLVGANNPHWKCDKKYAPPVAKLNINELLLPKPWYLIHRASVNSDISLAYFCDKYKANLLNENTVQFENRIPNRNTNVTYNFTIDNTPEGNNYWLLEEYSGTIGVWLLSNQTLAITSCYPASKDKREFVGNEIFTTYRYLDSEREERVRNELKGLNIAMNENTIFKDNKKCYVYWELWDYPKIAKHMENFFYWIFAPFAIED